MSRKRITRRPPIMPTQGRLRRDPHGLTPSTTPRRNPHAEKGLRLRPDLAALLPKRPRPDPHQNRGQRLRPELRRTPQSAQKAAQLEAVKLRIMADTAPWILIVLPAAEPWAGALRELAALGRKLLPEGGLALLHNPEHLGKVEGFDRLIPSAGISKCQILEAQSLLHARHVLFPEGLVEGAMARAFAARHGQNIATKVIALEGGKTVSNQGDRDLFRPLSAVMTLERNRFAPLEVEPCEGRVLQLTSAPEPEAAELLPQPVASLPLSQAELILSAGDGVTDWPGFHRLAEALPATKAGSRQVCDAGLLPRDRQVGASGTAVEARCYLAFGISGAPQHLQGITKCRHVVAVNTDLHAAMIKRADLAIIADAQAVMPALERLIAGGRT